MLESRRPPLSRMAICLLSLTVSACAHGRSWDAPKRSEGRWVAAWAASPQRSEPDDRPLRIGGQILRQIVRISMGGNRVRLRLSNAYGTAALLPDAAFRQLLDPRDPGRWIRGRATYEPHSDVSPAGWTSGSLCGSGDGVQWTKLLDVPGLASTDDVRTDVYWELATGELVVSVRNARGFGPGGRGCLLLHTVRR